jgi:hypothetical protein
MQWLLDGIQGFFESLWKGIKDTGLQFWGVIVITATLVWQGFTLIGDLTIQAVQALTGIANWATNAPANNIADSTLGSYFALANTIYPLDETVRLMASMVVGVWVPIGIYRLLKSWLPAGFAGGS